MSIPSYARMGGGLPYWAQNDPRCLSRSDQAIGFSDSFWCRFGRKTVPATQNPGSN